MIASYFGRVTEFDAARGLGRVVRDDPPGEGFWFHCIEIADGSRTIDVGAAVHFDVRAKLGRHEAVAIRTV